MFEISTYLDKNTPNINFDFINKYFDCVKIKYFGS